MHSADFQWLSYGDPGTTQPADADSKSCLARWQRINLQQSCIEYRLRFYRHSLQPIRQGHMSSWLLSERQVVWRICSLRALTSAHHPSSDSCAPQHRLALIRISYLASAHHSDARQSLIRTFEGGSTSPLNSRGCPTRRPALLRLHIHRARHFNFRS